MHIITPSFSAESYNRYCEMPFSMTSESSNTSAPLTVVLLREFETVELLLAGRGGSLGTGMLISSERSGDKPSIFTIIIDSKIIQDADAKVSKLRF